MLNGLAEIGAIVHCLQEIGRRHPRQRLTVCKRLDMLIGSLIEQSRLRELTVGEFHEHFRWVPGHEGEEFWRRAPRDGHGPFRFLMGTPPDEVWDNQTDEGPVPVDIPSSFWISATPMTLAQYRCMAPAIERNMRGAGARPVTGVTWFEAVLFGAWLDHQRRSEAIRHEWSRALPGLPEQLAFRLPTEAEWEFATRAGSPGPWCFGDAEGLLREYAWFDKDRDPDVQVVARLKPNAWGLYDVHGNVCEWCADWYEADLTHRVGPWGPESGSHRCVRGGACDDDAGSCRSAFRNWARPDRSHPFRGFRLCISSSVQGYGSP
jgi:formylglycine-generating enzyme required for sulfatase activity